MGAVSAEPFTISHHGPAWLPVQMVVACAPCGRRGRFAVSGLIEKYGDASMPSLLPELTNCPKWKSVGVYDRCKATYER